MLIQSLMTTRTNNTPGTHPARLDIGAHLLGGAAAVAVAEQQGLGVHILVLHPAVQGGVLHLLVGLEVVLRPLIGMWPLHHALAGQDCCPVLGGHNPGKLTGRQYLAECWQVHHAPSG